MSIILYFEETDNNKFLKQAMMILVSKSFSKALVYNRFENIKWVLPFNWIFSLENYAEESMTFSHLSFKVFFSVVH